MRVNVYIFSTNSLQQLKKFPFRNFERDFFHLYFFNAFFWRKWTFWGAPCRQDEHPDVSFVKMQRFFLSFWHFSPREVRGQYFWLKPPFKEFRTRLEEHWRVHWQDSRSRSLPLACTFLIFWWVPAGKPTCPLFWLKKELNVEGEQVKYFKIQFSFFVCRSNARSHSRHPFHDHTDGRRVADMSFDSKYIVKKGLNSEQRNFKPYTLLVNKHNRNRRANEGFTLQLRNY